MAAGRVILFIDELHLIMDAGRVEGGMNAGAHVWAGPDDDGKMWRWHCDSAGSELCLALTTPARWRACPHAANLLKPALARGELHCIGATTVEEYRKHVEADGAFARRFQVRGVRPCLSCLHIGRAGRRRRTAGVHAASATPSSQPPTPLPPASPPVPCLPAPPQPVMVEEPTPEEALTWLQGLRGRYERHHGVRYTDAALSAAVRAAQRYIPDRRLPDSAIDVIDEAAARARLHSAAAAAAVAAAQAQAAAGAAAAAAGQRGDPPLDAGGQSFADTQRLMEWLDSQQQPAAGQQEQQQLQLQQAPPGGLARVGAASTALGANAANALSCPHCGTPVEPPEDSGGQRGGGAGAQPCA